MSQNVRETTVWAGTFNLRTTFSEHRIIAHMYSVPNGLFHKVVAYPYI